MNEEKMTQLLSGAVNMAQQQAPAMFAEMVMDYLPESEETPRFEMSRTAENEITIIVGGKIFHVSVTAV